MHFTGCKGGGGGGIKKKKKKKRKIGERELRELRRRNKMEKEKEKFRALLAAVLMRRPMRLQQQRNPIYLTDVRALKSH